ncbi:MAG: dihydroorotase [Patescibacteria group bacterium]
MGNILLKGGRVIDPANNLDLIADVLIENGKVKKIGNLRVLRSVEVIDVKGKIVCPGLIDMHAHGCDFKQAKKENYISVSLAAIMGGFTTVACMANTDPVIDNVASLQQAQARMEGSLINLLQIVAISKELKGFSIQTVESLTKLLESGAAGFSDDGKAIWDPEALLKAMDNIHHFWFQRTELKKPLLLHCEDGRFSLYDKRSEYLDISLATNFAATQHHPIHIQHVSCAESVDIIRETKKHYGFISCETAPHYISLTEKDFHRLGANAKMNPPLRTEKDRQAVIRGLADGTIDAIATDHAPHTPEEKNLPLDKAPLGIIGLEVAVPVILSTLNKRIPLIEIIRKLTINPARILELKGKGTLHPGSVADITVIDPQMRKKVEADKFQSLSRNCPWDGKWLQGWPVMTIVGGRILMKDGKLNI